jgi:RNA recognition motif-containing protein
MFIIPFHDNFLFFVVKSHRRTKGLGIHFTNEPKGDATVTYEDPHAASAAVDWFDDKDFHGSIIQVHIAESKGKDTFDSSMNLGIAADLGGQEELDSGVGRGRGRGDGPGMAWQQDGTGCVQIQGLL